MYEDPQDMFQEMDEMFTRLFARMNRGGAFGEPQMFGYHIVINGGDRDGQVTEEPLVPARAGSEPVAEVHRLGDEVKVVVELPGAAAESLRLDAREGQLVISAEGCGNSYHTAADLPPVDAASMQSTFKNGVLEVTFSALPGSQETTGAGEN
nr:hypothetical protein [uncultured Methanoregula sp.]